MSNPSDDDFDKDLDEADAATAAEFAARFTLPADVMSSICPAPVDRQKLAALLQAVNAATSENEAQQKLVQHLASCGEVVVRLLKKIVLP